MKNIHLLTKEKEGHIFSPTSAFSSPQPPPWGLLSQYLLLGSGIRMSLEPFWLFCVWACSKLGLKEKELGTGGLGLEDEVLWGLEL